MIKVYINNKGIKGRFIVETELLKVNPKTVIVKLPNGKIIERDILKDLPEGLKVFKTEEVIKPEVKKQSLFERIKCQIQRLTSGHWGGSPRI